MSDTVQLTFILKAKLVENTDTEEAKKSLENWMSEVTEADTPSCVEGVVERWETRIVPTPGSYTSPVYWGVEKDNELIENPQVD